MVFIVVFLNEGPLEKQHLLKGYPSQIYQIKSNQIKSMGVRAFINVLGKDQVKTCIIKYCILLWDHGVQIGVEQRLSYETGF